MSRVLLLSVLGCCLGAAQTTKIDLQNQSRGVDFSAAPYTKPVKTGSALPPSCSTGEAYLLTTAVPGANFFVCTATNTWTLQGASANGVTDHSQLTHLDFASSGHTGFQPALGFTPVNATTLGQPNGPAKLGGDGKILASELPAPSGGLAVAFATEPSTGDGSRRVFTLAATPLPGSLAVSVNGQVQEEGPQADYILSGLNLTFSVSSAPANGARISFRYALSTGSGSTDVAFALDAASGNGSQSAFNLSSTPLAGSLMVAVNGQVQEPGTQADYTIQAGNSVVFNAASIPPSGARISFRYGYSTTGANTGGQISMAQLPAAIPNGLATLGSDGKVPAAQLPAAQGGGGGTQIFTTPSTTTWTVPSGVSRVFVQVWAAGGGGAAGYFASGVGGGGGGYAEAWCPVTAGSTMTVVVGAGGIAGAGGTPAGLGGDSSFGPCAHALGGGEGLQKEYAYYPGKDASMPDGYYLNANGAFSSYSSIRAGNPCSGCYPSRNDQGGSGANSVAVDMPGAPGALGIYGGAGGGSGANANGTQNQAGGTGGTSARGGSGGNGSGVAYGNATGCTAGSAPGGGGGGGAWNGSQVGNGCAGARGQVTLWW